MERTDPGAGPQGAGVLPRPAAGCRIHGYSYGNAGLATSPVTLAELAQIEASLLFGDEDVKYLRMSLPVLKDQVEGPGFESNNVGTATVSIRAK